MATLKQIREILEKSKNKKLKSVSNVSTESLYNEKKEQKKELIEKIEKFTRSELKKYPLLKEYGNSNYHFGSLLSDSDKYSEKQSKNNDILNEKRQKINDDFEDMMDDMVLLGIKSPEVLEMIKNYKK